MAQFLPFKTEVDVSRESALVVDLEGEESEAIFSALASDTSRAIYRALYEEPATASEVAKLVDTSVQNVRYHLEKLEDAGLIDAVDTWYSSRGNEMTVYAAMNEALIVAGDEHRRSQLRSLLKSTAGALGILAIVSLVLHHVMVSTFTDTVYPETGSNEGYISIQTATPTGVDVLSIEPGILIFLGGFAIIGLYTAHSFIRHHSRFAIETN